MLRNSCHAPCCEGAQPERDLERRPGQRAVFSPWPIATTLRSIGDAWREGLAAHRQYEALRSRGIPHDTALIEALGIRISVIEAGTARSQAAAEYRSFPVTDTARSDEAIMLRGEGLADSADPVPRPRRAAQIGNLGYVR